MDFHDYDAIGEHGQTHWWFAGKNRLVHSLIDQIAHLLPEKPVILDIGCGHAGELIDLLASIGKVIAIDNSDQILNCSKSESGHLIQCSASALPFKEETFDLIIMLDILEHIEDDLRMLLHICSKLKPGGHIFINVPAVPAMYGAHDRLLRHFRRYSRRSLLSLINKAHLKIERITYWNFFLFFPIFFVRLLKKAMKVEKLDLVIPPPPLNQILFNMLAFERILIHQGMNFPIGVSLVGWCRK